MQVFGVPTVDLSAAASILQPFLGLGHMLCIREDGGEADDATMSAQELRPDDVSVQEI